MFCRICTSISCCLAPLFPLGIPPFFKTRTTEALRSCSDWASCCVASRQSAELLLFGRAETEVGRFPAELTKTVAWWLSIFGFHESNCSFKQHWKRQPRVVRPLRDWSVAPWLMCATVPYILKPLMLGNTFVRAPSVWHTVSWTAQQSLCLWSPWQNVVAFARDALSFWWMKDEGRNPAVSHFSALAQTLYLGILDLKQPSEFYSQTAISSSRAWSTGMMNAASAPAVYVNW